MLCIYLVNIYCIRGGKVEPKKGNTNYIYKDEHPSFGNCVGSRKVQFNFLLKFFSFHTNPHSH